MIYVVELNFNGSDREIEWHAWYETYLRKLVTLDGLETAQRFRAVAPDAQHWEYLALYSITSLDMYDSEAYRNIGGGGAASIHFKDSISRRRNVYAGIEHMPAVTKPDGSCYAKTRPMDSICPIYCSARWKPRPDGARPARPNSMANRCAAPSP